MPRTISSTIKAVLDAQAGETHDIVEITLPASGAMSSVTMYCSGKKGLTLGSQVYLPVLRSISQIKMSLGGNSDAGEITLENISQTFGITLTDTDRTLDGSSVVIKRAFRVDSAGTYEAIELFRGVVQGVKINQELISLSVVSDMSQRNSKVANRQVTQKCIHAFNVNGSGIGPECGWRSGATGNPVDQAGNPLTCNKVFDSNEGCKGHANQHRFGGVPTLSATATTPGIGPGGKIPYDPDFPNGYPRRRPFPWKFDPDYRPWIQGT